MKKKNIIIICCGVIAISGVATFFATSNIRNYSNAEKLYNQKNYEKSAELFQLLGDYKDSASKFEAANHMLEVTNDKTPPQFIEYSDVGITVTKGDSSFDFDKWVNENFKAMDDVSENDIKYSVNDSDVNYDKIGQYTITISASDEAGNTESIYRNIYVQHPSEVYRAYQEAKNLNNAELNTSDQYRTMYNDIQIIDSELPYLEDGAIYRSLCKKIEGFYMEIGKFFYSGDNPSLEIILGFDSMPTWDEMKPYVDKAAQVVTTTNTLQSVMTAFNNLDSVNGTFDYRNNIYDFEITNLDKAASDLGISKRMLGYILAMLDEYGPDVEFGDNSYKCIWYRK